MGERKRLFLWIKAGSIHRVLKADIQTRCCCRCLRKRFLVLQISFILKVIYISCIKSNELLIIFYDLMEIFLPIDDLKLISFSFPFFAII